MSSIQFDKDSIKYTDNSNRRIIQDSVLPRCGTVCMWPGNVEPANAMFCDGSSLNKNSYPDLFTVIGYRYGGSGDNFNLPNFRNRYIFGNTVKSNNTSYTTGNWEIQNFNHVHNLDISSIDKTITSQGGTIESGNANNATKYNNNLSMSFTVAANTPDSKQKYIPYYTLCNYIIYY